MSKNKVTTIPRFLGILLSSINWILFVIITVANFTCGLILVAPFSLIFTPKTKNLIHAVAVNWARGILFCCIVWRLKVTGHENVDRKKCYVIVANHQSIIDILVSLAAMPVPFKFMAKRSLFPIPFLGWHMSLSGYIPLERNDRESGRKAVAKAGGWLDRGVSVLLYPEGTRSRDGEIQKFKMGAFKLAYEKGVEILPVVIDGTSDAVPKHSWIMQRFTTLHVAIGKPVSVKVNSLPELAVKKEEIRQSMIERLAAMRGVPRA